MEGIDGERKQFRWSAGAGKGTEIARPSQWTRFSVTGGER